MAVVCSESCQVNCQKTGSVWVAAGLVSDFLQISVWAMYIFSPHTSCFSYTSLFCGTVSLIWVAVALYQMDFCSQLGFHSSLRTEGLDHTVVQSWFHGGLKVNTASHVDIDAIHA